MYLLTECIARDISMRINDNHVQLIKHVIDQLNGISEQQRNELYTSALKALAAHKLLSIDCDNYGLYIHPSGEYIDAWSDGPFNYDAVIVPTNRLISYE